MEDDLAWLKSRIRKLDAEIKEQKADVKSCNDSGLAQTLWGVLLALQKQREEAWKAYNVRCE